MMKPPMPIASNAPDLNGSGRLSKYQRYPRPRSSGTKPTLMNGKIHKLYIAAAAEPPPETVKQVVLA